MPGSGAKAATAHNFDRVNRLVDASPFAPHLRFLNYGYAPLPGEPARGPSLGAAFPGRASAQLLFQLLADTDVTGATVLDVGCGRGGNLWLLDRFHEPASLIGVDLTASSLDWMTANVAGVRGITGDAEVLPIATASVDVVLSVESSSGYPDLEAAHDEVARVLRPGGLFLYADLLPSAASDPVLDAVLDRGFEEIERRDITPNVLRARARRARRERTTIPVLGDDAPVLGEYLGSPDSVIGRALEDGRRRYHLARFRRTATPPAPGRRLTPDQRATIVAGAAEIAAVLTPDAEAP